MFLVCLHGTKADHDGLSMCVLPAKGDACNHGDITNVSEYLGFWLFPSATDWEGCTFRSLKTAMVTNWVTVSRLVTVEKVDDDVGNSCKA